MTQLRLEFKPPYSLSMTFCLSILPPCILPQKGKVCLCVRAPVHTRTHDPLASIAFRPKFLGNWLPLSQFRHTVYVVPDCVLQAPLFFAKMSLAAGQYFCSHILFPLHAQWDGAEASDHSIDIYMKRTHCVLCKEQHVALSHTAFPFAFLWEALARAWPAGGSCPSPHAGNYIP